MDHNDDHAARRRCGARNHAPSAGVRALSLRIETRLGPNINLIIIVFIKRPLEISKDRWTDRSVPAETGGRTGSSEPRPVKKTGAPGTLHRSLLVRPCRSGTDRPAPGRPSEAGDLTGIKVSVLL